MKKKRKRGPPVTTGPGELVGVRLTKVPLDGLDQWISDQENPETISRPEAIRRMIKSELKRHEERKEREKNPEAQREARSKAELMREMTEALEGAARIMSSMAENSAGAEARVAEELMGAVEALRQLGDQRAGGTE